MSTKASAKAAPQVMKTSAPNTLPLHPLVGAFETLRDDAAALAAAVAAQAGRTASLAALRASEASTLAAVASEEINYKEGASRLAEVRGEADAIAHGIEIRAVELVGNANKALGDAVGLKGNVLAAISATAGGVLLERQKEVGLLLQSWGGTSSAPSLPVPATAITSVCPKLDALDGHRQRLEGWQFLDGFAALAKLAGDALDELGRHPVPAEFEQLHGGYSEQNRAQVVGWRGAERSLEVVASFASAADAAAAFAAIRARSGFLGFINVYLFDDATPRGQVHFPNENSTQLDRHQIRELTGGPDFDGRSAGFLACAAAWLS